MLRAGLICLAVQEMSIKAIVNNGQQLRVGDHKISPQDVPGYHQVTYT